MIELLSKIFGWFRQQPVRREETPTTYTLQISVGVMRDLREVWIPTYFDDGNSQVPVLAEFSTYDEASRRFVIYVSRPFGDRCRIVDSHGNVYVEHPSWNNLSGDGIGWRHYGRDKDDKEEGFCGNPTAYRHGI